MFEELSKKLSTKASNAHVCVVSGELEIHVPVNWGIDEKSISGEKVGMLLGLSYDNTLTFYVDDDIEMPKEIPIDINESFTWLYRVMQDKGRTIFYVYG
ncbi:MAG: hypothetical protein RR744_09720 [Cellulosilyticaceae bacterium]